MDDNIIKCAVLETYQLHCIKSFPIDCIKVLEAYGMKVKTYSSQKPKKYEQCMTYSKDAFTLKQTVYYNDTQIPGRIKFSLAHEIGHIALKHTTPRTPLHEKEADSFASHFLAPRMAIHYTQSKNLNDVINIFKLSEKAAGNAFNDYRRWRRDISIYGMSPLDKQMYEYFFNPEAQKFVWSLERCDFCYTNNAYNGSKLCDSCKIYEIRKNINIKKADYLEHDLDIARSGWLYGNL